MKKYLVYALVLTSSLAVAQSQTTACDPTNAVLGTYAFDLNLDGRKFQDIVVIKEFCPIATTTAKIKGSLTVPGNFTVPFEGGYEFNGDPYAGPLERYQDFEFNMTAIERGQELKAQFNFRIAPTSLSENSKLSCNGTVRFNGDSKFYPFSCFKFEKSSRYVP